MAQQRPIGRRAFLVLSAASTLRGQSTKGSTFVFPPQHFLDRATELDLYRLTDIKVISLLSPPHLHSISRRGRFLVHASNRSGSMQAYRLDWHTGDSRQLTSAEALDPAVALSADDRTIFYFDGPVLRQSGVGNLREHEIARVDQGWERAPGFSVSPDGASAVWVESRGGRSRLRRVLTAHGSPATVAEAPVVIGDPQIRPEHAQVLYRAGDGLHLVNADNGRDQALKLDPGGAAGQALWSPHGETLLYLSIPEDRKQLTAIRENTPEDGSDRLVSKTSQFASFGINGDASVFVGASRNLASPYVLLLVRAVKRELTLCEHRSADPASVFPVFSPDSQNVFFTTDYSGSRGSKSAIYRVHVDRFVEETGEETEE